MAFTYYIFVINKNSILLGPQFSFKLENIKDKDLLILDLYKKIYKHINDYD